MAAGREEMRLGDGVIGGGDDGRAVVVVVEDGGEGAEEIMGVSAWSERWRVREGWRRGRSWRRDIVCWSIGSSEDGTWCRGVRTLWM